jgi:hypothetical protein
MLAKQATIWVARAAAWDLEWVEWAAAEWVVRVVAAAQAALAAARAAANNTNWAFISD